MDKGVTHMPSMWAISRNTVTKRKPLANQGSDPMNGRWVSTDGFRKADGEVLVTNETYSNKDTR